MFERHQELPPGGHAYAPLFWVGIPRREVSSSFEYPILFRRLLLLATQLSKKWQNSAIAKVVGNAPAASYTRMHTIFVQLNCV
jgi:hypothetical protein